MGGTFDERAGSWDEDAGHVARADAIARRIRETVPLTTTMRVLDLGAGTGLLAERLADAVGPLTLVDPSAGMRKVAQRKVEAGVLGSETRVLDLDLEREDAPGERFELVVSMMALHHIHDVPAVLGRLRSMLTPGGTLAIADLDDDTERTFHAEGFDGHHGFSAEQLTTWLTAAGFVDVHIEPTYTMVKDDRPYELFLATARAPGPA